MATDTALVLTLRGKTSLGYTHKIGPNELGSSGSSSRRKDGDTTRLSGAANSVSLFHESVTTSFAVAVVVDDRIPNCCLVIVIGRGD